MKNSSNTIENRNRHLPTCRAVPQPTALRRAPKALLVPIELQAVWAPEPAYYYVNYYCHYLTVEQLKTCGSTQGRVRFSLLLNEETSLICSTLWVLIICKYF